jgi:AraC family transcriptional activator of pobA
MLHIEGIQSRSVRYRWEIDAHVHHGLHQVLWAGGGPVDVWLDGAHQTDAGPVAVVIPPGVVHAFRFSAETDGHVLTFNPGAVLEGDVPATGEALRELFRAPRVLSFERGGPAATRLDRLFADLADEFGAPDAAGSPVPLWLARSIVWRLARHGARQEGTAGRSRAAQALYTRFLVLVEAHHREHWPIRRYADKLGLTPARLNRLTREETGQSALELLHDRLAREACRRLTYIAAPIALLAAELGFEDPAYFCRFFKRRIGQSPRAFRQSLS